MKNFLRLIRLPNLIIVAILQGLIYFHLLMPLLEKYEIIAGFPPIEFGLFVLVTILTTAGGYIVNDLVDYDADIINKEGRVIIRNKIAINTASWIYYSSIVGGFLLALFLAFFARRLDLLWIFPVAVSGLFIYSLVLKRMVLLGNLLVSLFSGAVAAIVALAAEKSLIELNEVAPEKVKLFLLVVLAYAVFAFFTTFFREVVKDIEDMDGDAKAGFKTLPIVWGMPISKKIGLFIGGALVLITSIGLYLIFSWLQNYSPVNWVWPMLVGIVSIIIEVIAVWKFSRAVHKRDYWEISQLIKIVMILGIAFLAFMKLNY